MLGIKYFGAGILLYGIAALTVWLTAGTFSAVSPVVALVALIACGHAAAVIEGDAAGMSIAAGFLLAALAPLIALI